MSNFIISWKTPLHSACANYGTIYDGIQIDYHPVSFIGFHLSEQIHCLLKSTFLITYDYNGTVANNIWDYDIITLLRYVLIWGGSTIMMDQISSTKGWGKLSLWCRTWSSGMITMIKRSMSSAPQTILDSRRRH